MQNDPYNVILKRERENLGLSQAELAEKIDVSEDRIVRGWESGHHFPQPKHRRALCELYGKSAEDLGIARRASKDERCTSTNKTEYRRIVSMPPPIHPKVIQQRANTVKEIYEKLIQPDITAIALTGIGGVGKSTLAALIYHYVKDQYLAGKGPFLAEPLWLRVDPVVTMADLVATVFKFLGRSLPDLSHLSAQNQALILFDILNKIDSPLLVIMDQFENLLDWETGHALMDRVGIGEWLDAINSGPCRSRILLTSRPWPQGTRVYPATYMQEYRDEGLKIEEGIELLQKQGVKATRDELHTAVESCNGHAYALTLLASLLHEHKLSLPFLFKDPIYTQLWTGNIAQNLLDSLFKQQLNEVQRKLLVAFSVYREPVHLNAVQTAIDLLEVPQVRIELDLSALLKQHLLQAYGEGHYRQHAIVARYVQDHFVEDNEQANHQMKLITHTRAAQYYLQQAATSCPTRELRRQMSDAHDLIEAIWQWCLAERWEKAYNLIQREGVFSDLTRWGGSAILLGLYQQFLPLDKWQPNRAVEARIYNELSEIYNNLWQNERALEYCEQALNIYREIGDRDGEGRAFGNLGEIYSGLGKNERALEYCEQALSIYREIGDRDGEGKVLDNLGWLYFVAGQKQRALEYYEQALHIHRSSMNRIGEGIALNGLGLVNNVLGQNKRALDYYQQALSIRREIGDRMGESRTLNGFGLAYADLGQREQALDYYQQALSISREVGERAGESRQLNNIALVYADLGQNEQALDYYEQALSISREVGDREGEGWILTNLSKVYHAIGQREQALDYYEQALSISREVGDREGEGTILLSMGMLYFERKGYNVALTYFLLSRSAFEEVHGSDREVVQRWIDTLHSEIGEEQFAASLDQIEPQAFQIVT